MFLGAGDLAGSRNLTSVFMPHQNLRKAEALQGTFKMSVANPRRELIKIAFF